MEQTENFKREEAAAIIEHFGDSPVSNDLLLEFCNLHGYTPIGVETFEDYKFSYEHDKRLNAILPEIMAILSKIQNPPELASVAERQKILDANESLEEEIAYLTETHGILYQEIDLLLGGLGAVIKRTMDGASTRVNNMASRQLLRAAEEKFGAPLTIKVLGESQRAGKAFKTELEAKQEEPIPATHKDGCPVMTNAGEGHTFLEGCEKKAPEGAQPESGAV